MGNSKKKLGRSIAPNAVLELCDTTPEAELGGFRVLVGGAVNSRFSVADLAVLEPSVPAIELAEYLGKPEGFLADHRAASRPPQKHAPTDAERAEIASLRKSREHSPAKREQLISAAFARSRADRQQRLRECRVHAKRWITLVRLYELRRPWLLTLSRSARVKLCIRLAEDTRRASSNDIAAHTRAEARRRAANRKQFGKDQKRRRRGFGWRRKTDGVGGEGYAGTAHRRAALPMTPDGQVDGLALALSEILSLNATWRKTGTNSGVGIDKLQPWEPGGQWDTTEEQRIAKRITDEVKNFFKKKRDRSA